MNGLSADLRKTVSIGAAIIGVIACVVSAVIAENSLGMAISVVIGTCVAILNFNLMALAGEKAIEMEPSKAKTKMTINYLIRYAIYIVTLIVVIKFTPLSPIGVVVGFFTSILALYLTQVLNTPGNRDKLDKLLRRAK